METQQQQNQYQYHHENSQNDKTNNNSYLCRQSSSRWTPTIEQIKLLKELYYINEVRSPSADQIQAICTRLCRYGKIEGKNVFYWFQNHKARERQKKKLAINNGTNHVSSTNNNNTWKQDEVITKYPCNNNNNNSGMVSGNGQIMGSLGYGAVTMENKFRDCSISGVFNGATNPIIGGTTYAYNNNYHDKISTTFNQQDHLLQHNNNNNNNNNNNQIETLPLFPMHDKDDHHNNNHFSSNGFYTGGYRWSNGDSNGGGSGGASLELCLNSYGYGCYSHNY